MTRPDSNLSTRGPKESWGRQTGKNKTTKTENNHGHSGARDIDQPPHDELAMMYHSSGFPYASLASKFPGIGIHRTLNVNTLSCLAKRGRLFCFFPLVFFFGGGGGVDPEENHP